MNEDMKVSIDDTEYTVRDIQDDILITEPWEAFHVFSSSERAWEQARDYWQDLAEYDSDEFTCIVWKDTLVSWCLGKYAGPWTEKVNNLNDWFDLHIHYPHEHFANYDGEEREITDISHELISELWYIPKVAYRTT